MPCVNIRYVMRFLWRRDSGLCLLEADIRVNGLGRRSRCAGSVRLSQTIEIIIGDNGLRRLGFAGAKQFIRRHDHRILSPAGAGRLSGDILCMKRKKARDKIICAQPFLENGIEKKENILYNGKIRYCL